MKNENEPMVFGESLLERDFIRYCNFNSDIKSITYQPLTIQYNYQGKVRRYTPDFLLMDIQSNQCLVEVKPVKYVDEPENVVKFQVAKIFCEQKGWEFKVITNEDLYKGMLSQNINLLLDVQRHQLDTGEMIMVYERLEGLGSGSMDSFFEHVPELDRATFTAIVYRLLLDNYFQADLISQRISDKTVLHINEGKEW